jgi:hypothetical protein
MNLEDHVNRLPEEMVREIYDFVYPNKLRLLLSLYPKDDVTAILQTFSWEQLDRVYRQGCISKLFNWCPISGYEMWNIKPEIKSLFLVVQIGNQHYYTTDSSAYAYEYSPVSKFNYFWVSNNKTYKVYRPEYIRRITAFYSSLLDPPAILHYQRKNKKLQEFCEKTVQELISGILVIHNSNTKKHEIR